jgi:hypothetical protein
VARAIIVALLFGTTTLAAVSSAPSATAAGLRIKCTGAAATGLVISVTGCSGDTGGSGVIQGLSPGPPPPTFSGPIMWANFLSTTVTLQLTGVETDPAETLSCAAGFEREIEAKGTVTADSTGSAPVGGVAKFELCVQPAFDVRLEPGTAAKFK